MIRRFQPAALFGLVLGAWLVGSGGGCGGSVDGVSGDGGGDGPHRWDASRGDAFVRWDGGPPLADARPDGYVWRDGAPQIDSGGGTQVVPPLGGSSGGSGGAAAPNGTRVTAGSVSFTLIVPSSYSPSVPNALMIVYSGTEGEQRMVQNLLGAGPYAGLGDVIFAVLDGVTYRDNGQAGAQALDWVRSHYNIDNDRTYLLSESAGTTAGLQLGFQLRQSYFAAYWANDVVASGAPSQSATQLGFRPWGNAGPGGNFADAQSIVDAMRSAGYRLPADAPYSGAGSGQHGSPDQFLAALRFFVGKSRR